MCRLKSAIILRDSVYIPDHDSHSDMLDELGIADTQKNAEKLFVRAELTPKGDIFSSIDDWIYIVDQDILPDWYVEEYDKQRMIDAVKEWAKNHIHQNVNNLKITDGGTHYCKDCINVTLYDSSTAILYNSSIAELYDSSTAILYDSSIAELYNSSIAELYDSSIAELYDNSTAELYDNSIATLYDNNTAELYDNNTAILYNSSKAKLYDNSTGIIPDYASTNADKQRRH